MGLADLRRAEGVMGRRAPGRASQG